MRYGFVHRFMPIHSECPKATPSFTPNRFHEIVDAHHSKSTFELRATPNCLQPAAGSGGGSEPAIPIQQGNGKGCGRMLVATRRTRPGPRGYAAPVGLVEDLGL